MALTHPGHSRFAFSRNELIVDAAIAAGVFAVSVSLLATDKAGLPGGRAITALAVILAALTSLPLVARRRAPVAVFVVTGLASVALSAVAAPVGPPVGATVALFGLAASTGESRSRRRRGMGLVAAIFVAHVAAGQLAHGLTPSTGELFGVVLWIGVWVAGDRARLRRERIDELEERALRAERDAERERRLVAAEERMRIARDLHDSAGHAINVVLVHAGLGRMRIERDPQGAREAFQTIEDVARETVGEIEQLVGVLREDARRDGLGEVEPPPGVAALEGLVGRHRAAGLEVTTAVQGHPRPLAAAADRGAYRILQEALTNAARHGDGSVEVELSYGARELGLTVTNPVRPGTPARSAEGHGLLGMRERAALLDGSVETEERDGLFRVHARVPLGERG